MALILWCVGVTTLVVVLVCAFIYGRTDKQDMDHQPGDW